VSKIKVVGLGLATLDIIVSMKDLPTWDRGGKMSRFALDGGGMVGTAMVAAARLGVNSGYIGTAGNDYAAGIKVDSLARDGVDLSCLITREVPEHQVVLVYVNECDGERVFSGLRSKGVEPLRVEELDHDYITSAQYLHLDGTHHEAAKQAAKWMRKAGKTVIYDGTSCSGGIGTEKRELIKYVDVLICGEGFAPALTGKSNIPEAGRAALAAGPDLVVQTLGEKGSYTTSGDTEFHTPAFEVEVVDTTGAGDVFHGAYIVGMHHGWGPESVARFASAAAALKCQSLGGRKGIPDFSRVAKFLSNCNATDR